MSSCLSGGGPAYKLDLEIIKSTSASSWTSHSSSPSSTLSESSNSPLAISTRKPRTPRKRPKQTYNEAAALLSTACPKIFSSKNLTKPCSFFTKPSNSLSYESPDLLLHFQGIENSGFLLHHRPVLEKPSFQIGQKVGNSCEKPCQSPGEINFHGNYLNSSEAYKDDLDAESMLDEEIEEGIDSIMGNQSVNNDSAVEDANIASCYNVNPTNTTSPWYGYGYAGLGIFGNYHHGYGIGMGSGNVSAFRHVDDGDWWRYPAVNIVDITAKAEKAPAVVEKKKKKTVESRISESAKRVNNSVPKSPTPSLSSRKNPIPIPPDKDDPVSERNKPGLLLKLNYDGVLREWSCRDSPFPEDSPASGGSGSDIHARLAQIDLFSENGGVREASVLRYKEKRLTRLFSKKIRYQVRKVNADQRPRMKGRFVRRPNSPDNEEG